MFTPEQISWFILNYLMAWTPSAQSDIHAQTEEFTDYIYSLIAQAERDSQCVSHTLLNPILQW